VATVVQAGAIVFKRDVGELRVLIVTAKQNPSYWIFPKGHIEPGETAGVPTTRRLRA
jgi:8-oxo-dGTP pyrophosphatase MutT (NUDIX family)